LTTEPRRFARHLRRHATAAEDKLWQALRSRRLAGLKWRRQVPLLAYTVDFLCVSAKLVVEVDGASHAVGRARSPDRRALTPAPLPFGRGGLT
jgi:very-short-patch-repair endonuclease